MNGARGETTLVIAGRARRLCLTLGALAEIETALGCTRLSELEARLRALSAADLMLVLGALLRGGGGDLSEAELNSAGAAPGEAARAVAEAFRLGLSA